MEAGDSMTNWTLLQEHDSQQRVLYTLGLMFNLCGCFLIYKVMIVGTERNNSSYVPTAVPGSESVSYCCLYND